jgi:hypothetical protein
MTDRNKQANQSKLAYQKPRVQFYGFVRQLTQAGSVAQEEQKNPDCNPKANSFGLNC